MLRTFVTGCFKLNQPPQKRSKPGAIHLRIVEVLKRFPEGVSGGQIRHELEKEGLKPEEQTHLDRRKRDLKKWFVIQKIKISKVVEGKSQNATLYRYIGPRKTVSDEGQVDSKTRAHVIHAAHGERSKAGCTPTFASPIFAQTSQEGT
jgi:hypothetical protein